MKARSAVATLVSSFAVLLASVSGAQQRPETSGHPIAAAPTPADPGSAPSRLDDHVPPFEGGLHYDPLPNGARLAFSLQDADLPDLIRALGNITGKRFILGKNARSIKASVYSPTRVTAGEAYQAFLSVLDANGLTATPDHGFIRIDDATDAGHHAVPTTADAEGSTTDQRFVTRIHRLHSMTADDAAALLAHFKSHDGDVTAYPPTNTVIITDTGANIRRMMQVLEEVDVPSVGLQIWIEQIHYANASDLSQRLTELLNPGTAEGGRPASGGAAPQATQSPPSDTRLARLMPDERSNSMIIVATERMYLRVLELIRRLDVPVEGEGEVHVYYLQHSDADELSTTLNAMTGAARPAAGAATTPTPGAPSAANQSARSTAVFEGSVRITPDKRTNALVITSSPRDYASVRRVIGELDHARREVYLEGVVMELSVQDTSSLGVSWHGGNPVGSSGQALAIGGFNAGQSATFPNQSSLQGLALGVRAISGFTIPGLSTVIPQFGAVLNAIATSGDGDILGTPSIIATDNTPAEISVGENIATQLNAGSGLSPLGALSGTSSTSTSASSSAISGFGFGSAPRQDVGTKIHIVPHINDSSDIRLEIEEEISAPTADSAGGLGALGIINISKRTAKTTVTVRDQETVVIGGLINNSVQRSTSRIPILGDIPILGALFRTDTRTVNRTNLLLFLTPYLIRDQSDLRQIFERKMRERQEFLDRYFVFSESGSYHPAVDYSRTNGLVEEIRQAVRDMRVDQETEARAVPRPPPPHSVSEPIDLPTNASIVREPATDAGTDLDPPTTLPRPPSVQTPLPRASPRPNP